MTPLKVFLIQSTGRYLPALRRYSRLEEDVCVNSSYHNAVKLCPELECTEAELTSCESVVQDELSYSYTKWPKKCELCDYEFEEDDVWQFHPKELYSHEGQKFTLDNAPPGSVYYASWYEDSPAFCSPADGRAMMAVLPTGQHWYIDGQARNCPIKEDRAHRCWVRSGSVELGTLHVDKQGVTCTAGAGSIDVPGFHGFLHHGHFVAC